MSLLHHLVTRQAGLRPDAPAVVAPDRTLTYGELDARSDRLARLLQDAGCRPGDRVCLLVPKSAAAIAAIIGILKAGCVYVPLDPGSPAPRLAKMLAACEPALVLAVAATGALADALGAGAAPRGPLRIGWIEGPTPGGMEDRTAFTAADLDEQGRACTDHRRSPQTPAYILFTSGSTGEPKGVVITHANVSAFLEWAVPYFGIDETDRLSGHPPLHFDLSVFDVFGAFAAGASLYPVPPEVSLLPHKVAAFIRAHRLTQWFSVPSLLAYMARFGVVRQGDFPTLKRLLWCGEVFPTPPLVDWMRRLPHARFVNLYGPTEATIASSYHELTEPPSSETAEVPIGRACGGEELLVLGPDLRPVTAGQTGDLYIRGVGLSPGYWRDPQRTQEAFLVDPTSPGGTGRLYRTGDLARIGEDGLVYFEGRSDHQIKSRGYRIELGEVENSLYRVGGLAECAVFPTATSGFEGTALACAFVRLPGSALDAAAIRAEISTQLPSYMLPTKWLELDTLPKNQSGKIDRRELATMLEAG